MKFSESWLREWVNPAITTDELTHQITMAGLEVDDVLAVAGVFDGVKWVTWLSVLNIQMLTNCASPKSM